jgi:hypothetical protein
MIFYRLLFVVAVLALLCVGQGCAHTTVEYVDPARPEAVVRVARTTFLRHGRVDVQFPINADVRIVDEPISADLATVTLFAAAAAGAVAGPAGAATVLFGTGFLAAVGAIANDDEPAQAEQDAPPTKPSEQPSVLPPTAQWNQFTCGGVLEPGWCR